MYRPSGYPRGGYYYDHGNLSGERKSYNKKTKHQKAAYKVVRSAKSPTAAAFIR